MNRPLTSVTRRQILGGAAGMALVSGVRRAGAAATEPRRPFPYAPDYRAGTNYPTSPDRDQQIADIRAAYNDWAANYLVDVGVNSEGNPMMRVAFGKPGTPNHEITVSEGQGYGMVIVPHMAGHDPDAQLHFDGLWRFAQNTPSSIDSRLMGWHVPIEGDGNDSAFDGDCDIAYGLLLADAQWGSDGEIDYRAAALEVLDGMMESTIGSESRYPLLGDWVYPEGDPYNQWTTRPSDFMLGHFHAFARATGDPAWNAVADACAGVIATIQSEFSPETGLLPDFVQPASENDTSPRPADPGFLEGENDGAYSYNAGRTPWRIGIDALVNGTEASVHAVRKISAWIEEVTDGVPQAIRAGYTLDGTPLEGSDYVTSFFVAPFAVAAMNNPNQQEWLNALYASIRVAREDYYEDSVTLLCMLAITGTFWDGTE